MTFARRQFLQLAAVTATLPAISRVATAETYPSRAVHLIVAFPPGGAGDILARLIGRWLSDRLGQPFVVENQPGGGSNVATEAVVNAPSDGYTLLVVSTSAAVNASLYEWLPFNFLQDIEPVAGLLRVPNVLEVHPSFPATSVPEFIAYAKANPGSIKMGKVGTGQSPHMSAELFKMMVKIEVEYVPYPSTPAMLAGLLAGQVHCAFDSMTSSIEHIRAGKLRALAVTTAMRSEAMPEVPTIGDFVPGYEASGWFGIGAPRNTPAEVVDSLNHEINAALTDSKVRAQLIELGGMLIPGSPADFGELIAEETQKWARVLKFSATRPD
jgi:tripartite-type tricarboxylate transporter receptor subunit TctC